MDAKHLKILESSASPYERTRSSLEITTTFNGANRFY